MRDNVRDVLYALIFAVATVAVVVMIVVGATRSTESVTRRHAAGYEACSHAAPELVTLCVAEVKR